MSVNFTFTSDFTFTERSKRKRKAKVGPPPQTAPLVPKVGVVKLGAEIHTKEEETHWGTMYISSCPLNTCKFRVRSMNEDGALTTIRRHINDTHKVER